MVGLLLFAGSFALYAVTAEPAIGWLDSPEFAAAAHGLGIPHSPGHPLFVLIGKAFSLLPIGSLAFRVNLASAACAATAVTATYAVGLEVLRFARADSDSDSRSMRVFAVAGACAVAVCPALWVEATRAEVYGLSLALSMAGLCFGLRFVRTRRASALALAGLLFGLALANHHLLAIVFLLPLALVCVLARPSIRACGLAALGGTLGLATYLYMPVRAAGMTMINFGHPSNASRLAWTVSGSAFQKSAGADHTSTPTVDLVEVVYAVLVGAPLALFATLALYIAVRDRVHRGPMLALIGIAGLAVIARVALGFDPETPDHHAYLLPAIACGCVAAVFALYHLYKSTQKRASGQAAVVAAIVVLMAAAVAPGAFHRSVHQPADYAADELARFELLDLPPRSLLLSAYFQTRFRTWALVQLEDARPDVDILDRSFLTYPGMATLEATRQPKLADLIESGIRPGDTIPLKPLREQLAMRPVWFQLHPNVGRDVLPLLLSDGAHARMSIDAPGERERTSAESSDNARRLSLVTRLGDGSRLSLASELALLWHDAMRLDFYCTVGRKAAAQTALESALAMFPFDRQLLQMGEACGLDTRTAAR